MPRAILFWYVYHRENSQDSPELWASGSDPLEPEASPVQKLVEIITRFTGKSVVPQETEPNNWAWYSDPGPSPQWIVFGEQQK